MDKPRKVYLLTEEQMGDVNYLLCVLSKEIKDTNQSRLVSKAINTLAQAMVIKSDDRLNGALGTFINAMTKV